MRTKKHVSVDIKGALMHWQPESWLNCVTNDDGRVLTPSEVKSEFLDALSRGERLVSCAPPGECVGFDPVTGCPGHPMEDSDALD